MAINDFDAVSFLRDVRQGITDQGNKHGQTITSVKDSKQFQYSDIDPNRYSVEDFGGDPDRKSAFDKVMASRGVKSHTILKQEEDSRAQLEEMRKKYPYPEQRAQMGIATKDEYRQVAEDWQKTRRDFHHMENTMGRFGRNLYSFGQQAARGALDMIPGTSRHDMPAMDPGIQARMDQSSAGRIGKVSGEMLPFAAGVGLLGKGVQMTGLPAMLSQAPKVGGALAAVAQVGAPAAAYEGARGTFDPADPTKTSADIIKDSAIMGTVASFLPGLAHVTKAARRVIGKTTGGIKTEEMGNSLLTITREVVTRPGWDRATQGVHNFLEGAVAEIALSAAPVLSGKMTLDQMIDQLKTAGALDAALGLATKRGGFTGRGELEPHLKNGKLEVDTDLIKQNLSKSGLTETIEAVGYVSGSRGAQLSPGEIGPLMNRLRDAGLEDVARGLADVQAGNRPGGPGALVRPPFDPNMEQMPQGLPAPPDAPPVEGLSPGESTLLADVTRQSDEQLRGAEGQLAEQFRPMDARPDMSELTSREQRLLEETTTPVEGRRREAEEELQMGEGRRIEEGHRIRGMKATAAMPTKLERNPDAITEELPKLRDKGKLEAAEGKLEGAAKSLEKAKARKVPQRKKPVPEKPAEVTAESVNAAAYKLTQSGKGLFGEDKVFVSDIAKEMGIPVAELAPKLAEMYAKQELDMSRADLVEAMDEGKVKESEVRAHGGRSELHFVRPTKPAAAPTPPKTDVKSSTLDAIVAKARKVTAGTGRSIEEIARREPLQVRYSDKDLSPAGSEAQKRVNDAIRSPDDTDYGSIAKDLSKLKKDEAFEVAKRTLGRKAVAKDSMGQPIRTKRALIERVSQLGKDRKQGLDRDDLTGLGSQNAWKAREASYDKDSKKRILMADVAGLGGANDYGSYVIGDDAMKSGADQLKAIAKKHGIADEDMFRSGGDEFAVAGTKEQVEAVHAELKDFTSKDRFFQAFKSKKGWVENRLIVGKGNTSEAAGKDLSKTKERYKQWASAKGIFISKKVEDPFQVLRDNQDAFKRLPRDLRAEITAVAGDLARAMKSGGDALDKAKSDWDLLIGEAKQAAGVKELEIEVTKSPEAAPTHRPETPKGPTLDGFIKGEKGEIPIAAILAGPKALARMASGLMKGLTQGGLRASVPTVIRNKLAAKGAADGFIARTFAPEVGTREIFAGEDASTFFWLMSNKGEGITFDKDAVMHLSTDAEGGDTVKSIDRFRDPNDVIDPSISRERWEASQAVLRDQEKFRKLMYDKDKGVLTKLRKEHGADEPLHHSWEKKVDMDAYREANERIFNALDSGDASDLRTAAERDAYTVGRGIYKGFQKRFEEHYDYEPGKKYGFEDYINHITNNRSLRGQASSKTQAFRRPGFQYKYQRTGSTDILRDFEAAINDYIPKALTYLHFDKYANYANEKVFGLWRRVKGSEKFKALVANGTVRMNDKRKGGGTPIQISVSGERKVLDSVTGKPKPALVNTLLESTSKDGITVMLPDDMGKSRKFTWENIDKGKVTIYAQQGGMALNQKTGKQEFYGLEPLFRDKGWENRLKLLERYISDLSNPRATGKLLEASDAFVGHLYKAFLGMGSVKAPISNSLGHIVSAGYIGVGPWARGLKAHFGGGRGSKHYTDKEINGAYEEIVGLDPYMGILREGVDDIVLKVDPSGTSIAQGKGRARQFLSNVYHGRLDMRPWSKQGRTNLLDWSMVGFRETEAMVRGAAGLGSYIRSRETGQTHREAILNARDVIRRTHGTYSKESSPQIFRQSAESEGKNILKRTGLQFQRYLTVWTLRAAKDASDVYYAGRIAVKAPDGVTELVPVPGTKDFNDGLPMEQQLWKSKLKAMPDETRKKYEKWARTEDYARVRKEYADPQRALLYGALAMAASQAVGSMLGQEWGAGVMFDVPFGLYKGFSEMAKGEDPTRYMGSPTTQFLVGVGKSLVRTIQEGHRMRRQAERGDDVGPRDVELWNDWFRTAAVPAVGPTWRNVFERAMLTKKLKPGDIGYSPEKDIAVYGFESLFTPSTPIRKTSEAEYLRRIFLPGQSKQLNAEREAIRQQRHVVQDFWLARRDQERQFDRFAESRKSGDIEAARKAVDRINRLGVIYNAPFTNERAKEAVEKQGIQPVMKRVLEGNVASRAENLVKTLKQMKKQPQMLSEAQVRQMLEAVFGHKDISKVSPEMLDQVSEAYTDWLEARAGE